MHCAGGTGLSLHLLYLDGGAEDVLAALRRPLVNIVGHRAGRGDGVNRGDFGKRIGYMGGCVVAVHRFEVSHNDYLSSFKVAFGGLLNRDSLALFCQKGNIQSGVFLWFFPTCLPAAAGTG